MLTIMRNIILLIGWPVLIGGSVYLFVKGKKVYDIVGASMVGNMIKILVLGMMVEMYSLGIVATVLMWVDINYTYLVVPVFIIWFIIFILSLKTLREWELENERLLQQAARPAEAEV